jgi:hypothetical protein
MYKHSEAIKITYSLFDEQVITQVDALTTLEHFINHIANSHGLNPNDLELTYNNKRMGLVDLHKFIRDIVGGNPQPFFYIKTKSERIPLHLVTIEHFPSRPELYDLLHGFLHENSLSNTYKEEHRDNWVRFSFYESVS